MCNIKTALRHSHMTWVAASQGSVEAVQNVLI